MHGALIMNKPEFFTQLNGEQIRIRGLVQGVGFRPTVYRIAQQLKLTGEVNNDGSGVNILIQADTDKIDEFINQIKIQCPLLARIDAIERSPLNTTVIFDDFSISVSKSGNIKTGIIPDASTCSACLEDIQNSEDRRYQYPFTNCTHCGPRLSIIEHIPYDRTYTSMKHFKLCPTCKQEYEDPGDRRFHAQPNACPDCGPFLRITDATGKALNNDDILTSAAELIQKGHILAIKGIGGFQLACDAGNDQAIEKLRLRKQRPAKALALMASNVEQISDYCLISKDEKALLESSAAPIVVLQQSSTSSKLSGLLAHGQHSLGFMLPYSPLHHILMQKLDCPIVLTSGNASDEPQCIDNQQAIEKLGHIADYFVLHNRHIVNRIDDSVVRKMNGQTFFYRRARGYAPTPLLLADEFNLPQSILALGGELKNTFCLLQNQQATLSQHMGNLENLQTYNDYLKNIKLYQQLFDFEPDVIVIDKHPEYLSSKLGRQWSADKQIPLIEVQHHHAHITSCLADNLWPVDNGPVIGVALDGLGFGEDGTVWGGEFLVADYREFTRLACLKPVPLPGAVKAMIEPWRNTYAQLTQDRNWSDISSEHSELPLTHFFQQQPIQLLDQMISKNVNSPLSSSCGRLFDAFAAALGICQQRISYEGQAAIELEALITEANFDLATPYPFEIQPAVLTHINTAPMWRALLNDLQQNKNRGLISAKFHMTLAHIICRMALNIQKSTGIDTVALSGGVFQNATLLKMSSELLSQHSFRLLTHRHVPSNDGGLALGQAVIAGAQYHQHVKDISL